MPAGWVGMQASVTGTELGCRAGMWRGCLAWSGRPAEPWRRHAGTCWASFSLRQLHNCKVSQHLNKHQAGENVGEHAASMDIHGL